MKIETVGEMISLLQQFDANRKVLTRMDGEDWFEWMPTVVRDHPEGQKSRYKDDRIEYPFVGLSVS